MITINGDGMGKLLRLRNYILSSCPHCRFSAHALFVTEISQVSQLKIVSEKTQDINFEIERSADFEERKGT